MLNKIIDNISASVPQSENEYVGMDGYLYCKDCGDKLQTDIELFGQKRRVRCICTCRKKERDAHKDREQQEENKRKKMVCFAESNMMGWTFENDDRRNPKLSDAMMRYAENFQNLRKDGTGLLLYGTVGTGKSYYAACIANRLIDQGHTALMTNFARLTNTLQGMYSGKQEYIDGLNRYSLLVLDDLGAERKSEFMQEQIFNIIDARYRSGLPFIITTNLTAEEIKKPQDIGNSRIYDRILDKCHPIEIAGVSRRRMNLKENYSDINKLLGL